MKSVQDKIKDMDPWYVADQLQQITNEHQKRTILERWRFFEKVINTQRENCMGTLKLLDAGCGDGVNLHFLKNIPNISITAYDYNPLRVENVQSIFPEIPVEVCDLTKIRSVEPTYDIIICSHVIEHIYDDVLALNNLKMMMQPHGRLILGTPNEGCLFAQLRNNILESYIYKTTDHVQFYTMKTLTKKFTDAGFEVEDKLMQNLFFPTQRINNFFASRDWGFSLMKVFMRLFPSQCAGYYFSLLKA